MGTGGSTIDMRCHSVGFESSRDSTARFLAPCESKALRSFGSLQIAAEACTAFSVAIRMVAWTTFSAVPDTDTTQAQFQVKLFVRVCAVSVCVCVFECMHSIYIYAYIYIHLYLYVYIHYIYIYMVTPPRTTDPRVVS